MMYDDKVRCENCGRLVESKDAIFSNESKGGFWKSLFSVREEHWVCKECHEKLADLKK